VSPQSCRHYFGASLISRGVSVVAVSRWMGHASPKITWDVYAYMMAADADAGRAAMRDVTAKIVSADGPHLDHLEASE
jgi:integrase